MVEPPGEGIERNRRNNPMQSKLPMHLSPRCRARIRTGTACGSPAMPNGRCRMHGGTSPGAPKGNKNALKIENSNDRQLIDTAKVGMVRNFFDYLPNTAKWWLNKRLAANDAPSSGPAQ